MQVVGWMCGHSIYEYEGWLFEYSIGSGPWPLKKDGEPRKRAGKKFYKMFDRFDKLPDEEQAKYRVGGGCVPLVRREDCEKGD